MRRLLERAYGRQKEYVFWILFFVCCTHSGCYNFALSISGDV